MSSVGTVSGRALCRAEIDIAANIFGGGQLQGRLGLGCPGWGGTPRGGQAGLIQGPQFGYRHDEGISVKQGMVTGEQ